MRPFRSRTISIHDTTNRKNLLLLVQLRWLAVAGQIATIALVQYGMGIDLPLAGMASVVSFLAVLNVISRLRHRTQPRVTSGELFLELMLDVAALTIQLYLSGGATNPFITLFLLQVILGAVLLEAWATWMLVALTSACFLLLMVAHRALAFPGTAEGHGLGLHVFGMFVSYVLSASLLVLFVTRITGNLRLRDARLAALRQQSAEEELILRMGLLASGAAHELGTPLSTMAVILNDWQKLPVMRDDSEIAEDLAEMQAQIGRCKQIVSRVLVSAGSMRGEGTVATTVVDFFDQAATEWLGGRDPGLLQYDNRFAPDQAIAVDLALRQGLFNALDNAFEVSPAWVGLDVQRDDDCIVATVSDKGPGFTSGARAAFGQPYHSTKEQAGGGLGLFLLANAVRKLGGSVRPESRPGGGAAVRMQLPLRSLALE